MEQKKAAALVNRYTVWTVIVLLAVLAAVLIGLNAVFAVSLGSRTENLLLLIKEYGADPEAVRDTDGGAAGRKLSELTGMNPYMNLRTSSYFLTVVSPEGKTLSEDMTGAVQVSRAEAELMTSMALETGTDSGRVNEYAFLRYILEEGSGFAFVGTAYPVMQQIGLATASVATGCIGGGLLLAYTGICAARVIAPLQRRCTGSGQLMQACADRLLRDDSSDTRSQTAAMLEAGADLLGSRTQTVMYSLTELFAQTAEECRPEADGRNVRIETVMQPNVLVRSSRTAMATLLGMLLKYAAATAQSGCIIHADLLADGKTAAVLVQYVPDTLHADAVLPAVQMLAGECAGSASFQKVDADSVCYTVRMPQKHLQGMPAGK